MDDEQLSLAIHTLDETIAFIVDSLAQKGTPTGDTQLEKITELADQLTSIIDARQALFEERGRRL
jgi:hypothetical protein